MKLVIITALIAVCGTAKLDRTYLPPPSAKTAGGSSAELQAPKHSFNNGLGGLPKGSYENEFQGVVVDAVSAGVRASEPEETGLGAPRISYGSTDSKVGAAAFKTQPSAFQTNQKEAVQFQNIPQGFERPQSQGFNNQNYESRERARAPLDRAATILKYEYEVSPERYNYAFETDNGISAQENGEENQGIQAQGAYSYTGDDGNTYSVTYTADERGFQPQGVHLPTPPPIPEEILRSLQKNAMDEAAGIVDDGSYDARKYNVGSDYTQKENANGKYQSTKLGNEADAVSSGTFIDQNQAFRKPSSEQKEYNNQESQRVQNGQANRFSNEGSFSSGSVNTQNQAFRKPSSVQKDFNNQVPPRIQNGQANRFSNQGSLSSGSANTQSFNNFNGQTLSKFTTQSSQPVNRNYEQNEPAPETGFSDDHSSSKQFEQASAGVQGQDKNFESFSSASVQSSTQGQSNALGNRNEYLPPSRSNGKSKNGRPQNRPQNGGIQNNKPQLSVATDSDKDFNKDQEGSSELVPLGQQNLQRERRPQQTVTSFGKPVLNTNRFTSQNELSSSSIQNMPSNGRQPLNGHGSSNENDFVQTQVNTNRLNDYLPPYQINQPQGTVLLSHEYDNNANKEQTQNPSAFPSSPAFETRPQQTNGFQRPQSLRPSQNENKYQVQPSTQFNTAFSQSSVGLNSQKSTALPATELTTPFESDYDYSDSNKQALANFSSSSNPDNDQPTQPTIAAYYNNAHNLFGSQSKPQSSQPFGQTKVPTFPTQASAVPFGQNSQIMNRPRPQGFAPKPDPHYAASTQRPSYVRQQQGPDDSYIYNQPARPFSIPQGSRFPSAPFGQFNRITQQSSFAQSQSLSSSQDASSMAISSSQPQHSNTYPRPPGLAPIDPTSQPQKQSTKYPRPPSLSLLNPSFSSQSNYQTNVNGVTQASISRFPPQPPTESSQYNDQSQFDFDLDQQLQSQFGPNSGNFKPFAQKPTQPSLSQQTTGAFSKRPTQFRPQTQNFEQQNKLTDRDTEPMVISQQYTGEIYEYKKPAQTLPPPDSTPVSSTVSEDENRFSSSRPQIGVTNDQGDQTQSSQFSLSRPQFNVQARPQNRPQNKPQFSHNTQPINNFGNQPQQTEEDMKPYGALAQSISNFESSRPQIGSQSRPQPVQSSFSQNKNTELVDEKYESENEPSDAEVTTSQPPKYRPGQSVNEFVQNPKPFETPGQNSKNQNKLSSIEPICCKNNASASKTGQSQPVEPQSQSVQTSFSGVQNQPSQPASSSSFAGQGEVFGGPRQPPRYDPETGYHY